MTRFLLVAIGGGLGAMARYGLGLAVGRLAPGAAWPWATLTANVAGGLLMGLLVGWLALRAGAGQESIRLFAAVGLLGGFTTFSAFSLDTLMLWERGQPGLALIYVILSVTASLLAVFAGLALGRSILA